MPAPIFLNTAGAYSKDLSQGRATWFFNRTIKADKPVKIGVNTFGFINRFINISAALGNNTIYYSDDATAGQQEKYSVVIPSGSYSVTSLNSYIEAKLVEDGYAPGLFTIKGNSSLDKAYITFSATLTGWYIYFKTGASPYGVLGWNAEDFVPATQANVVNELEIAPNVAEFNNVQEINVRCSLITQTLSNNDVSNVLYTAIPSTTIGSPQTDKPRNIIYIESESFRGGFRKIDVQLVDQNNLPIVVSDFFSLVITVEYV